MQTSRGSRFKVQGSRRGRGQLSIEYAALLAIVVAALITMQIYVKRGISGRLRQTADAIGAQYGPRAASSSMTYTMSSSVVVDSEMREDQDVGGGVTADVMKVITTIDYDTTTRSGTENLAPMGASAFESD